ncbi:hypothetical protein ACR6C2_13635 [Streptomyces sp. INA 01156]
MPRLALYAFIVCLLTVAAAVVSFARGSWAWASSGSCSWVCRPT